MRVSLTALWNRGKSCKPNAEDIPIYTMLRRSQFRPSDNRKAMLGKLSERVGSLESLESLESLGVIGIIGIIGIIGSKPNSTKKTGIDNDTRQFERYINTYFFNSI